MRRRAGRAVRGVWVWVAAAGVLWLLGLAGCVSPGAAGLSGGEAARGVRERERRFERVERCVERRYYAADLRGLDWAALCASFRPHALAATQEHVWYATVNRMLGYLQDAHTRVEPPKTTRSGEADRRREAEPRAVAAREVREYGGRVLYLRFGRFDRVTTSWLQAQMRTREAPSGLILDFRDNTGGCITAARQVAGLFFERPVPMGIVVPRNGPQRVEYSRPGAYTVAAPLVVLIGRGSHSSAEVVAYALRHHRRAVLVGERTAGEVLGARRHRLPGGGALFVSEADFWCLEGGRLEGVGLEPDLAVDVGPSGAFSGEDPAILAALDVLRSGISPGAVH